MGSYSRVCVFDIYIYSSCGSHRVGLFVAFFSVTGGGSQQQLRVPEVAGRTRCCFSVDKSADLSCKKHSENAAG